MTSQAGFALRGRNPDVLTCIANLSNDEVFTPPEFANRMLDTLTEAWAANHGGANLWADKTVRFLDPCTKSGVFLREITRRLTEGLAGQIPDLGERVDHIVTKQVFGIGITRLTSLLARRSVYCSVPTPSLSMNAVLDWYRAYSSLAAMPHHSSSPPTALELLLHETEATPREYWTDLLDALRQFRQKIPPTASPVIDAEQARKNQAAIDLLDSWLGETEDATEHQQAWNFLKTALDEDRLSDRPLFP